MPISKVSAQERLRAAATLRANDTTTPPTTPEVAPRQPDGVTISDAGHALAAARKAVAGAADVREDRISTIKAAIAAGTYSVDSHQLASDIVKDLDR